MSERIWASLDDYLPPEPGNTLLGRTMANAYFLSALLKHASFDTFHFFLSNAAHCSLFRERHAPLFERLGVSNRIVVQERTALKAALGAHDYTVFHQGDHVALFNNLCRVRNRLGAGFPVTAFIHSISYQQYMKSYIEMREGGVTPKDAIICSSRSGLDAIAKCFARLDGVPPGEATLPFHAAVVPLGIDEGAPPPERTDARARLGVPAQRRLALVLGRFSEVDKMDLFPVLQAFQIAARSGDDRHLILAGAVHGAGYLKMLRLWIEALRIGDRVTIWTNPDEDTKRQLLGAADFFVSAADNPQETFGLTILEAMWAGLPLLVSDFDGYRELVSDEVGIRVPTYWAPSSHLSEIEALLDDRTFHLFASQSVCVDVAALAEGFERLFTDLALCRRFSANARRRFEAGYSHRAIIGRLERLWLALKDDFEPAARASEHLSLDMFDTFSHYVTAGLPGETLVATSQFGNDILKRRSSYPLLSNMGAMVDRSLVIDVMSRAREPRTVSALCASLAGRCPDGRYLLLWMLKHDLLRMTKR